MSHEIYYTSAPEGLKRGTSGFSTVATSDNIPKPLWDRLETLSAYRHEYTDGTNPISFAHWILNLAGKTHHVLSRICDSGMDHTQRTNAFAHHLVLDHSEIERALAGPAWMLRQPGVMANVWDGKVGTIGRQSLPTGDDDASKICHAWEGVTGDAGWGGHLADLFAKSPTRPVCLLFGPGQDILPLMAESIALLPPAARWNATFNTYFTSMPNSATCLWRCCLAGTQAAQVGLRYAAGGLILDLTDRTRLPALPPGPYVAMARSGISPDIPAPPIAVKAPARAADPTRVKAAQIYDLASDPDAGEDDDLPEFNPPDPSVPEEATEVDSAVVGSKTDAAASKKLTVAGKSSKSPARSARAAQQALDDAEQDADRAAQRRRKQVMLLFIAGLSAIAVGSGLVFLSVYRNSPPDLPAKTAFTPTPPPKPAPVVVAPPPVAPVEPPPRSQNAPAPVLAETKPMPIIPAPTPPVVVKYPDQLTLTALLDRPSPGAGIGERLQSLAIPARDLDPAPISDLKIAFPANRATPSPNPSATATYAHSGVGTLTAKSETRNNEPGVALNWKNASDPPAEVAFIAINGRRTSLDIHWRAATLLRNTGSISTIFWTLQSSLFQLGTSAAGQFIAFKQFPEFTGDFSRAETAIPWPVELPRDAIAIAPPTLGPKWKAEWYPDWETKDPALRTPEKAIQVLKFKKPTSTPAVDSFFLLTFNQGFTKVQSNFAKRFDADSHDLAQFESDLRAIDNDIQDAKARNNGTLAAGQGTTDLLARHDQTAALVDAYKAAVAGYKELTPFDVALEMPDGMRLATLHFQPHDWAAETGK